MKTIFVMVKCELGKAYQVADEAILNICLLYTSRAHET